MLVHIILALKEEDIDIQAAPVLKALREAGVRDIDTKFLKSYSLVAGDVDPADIETVKALPHVLDVEPDGHVSAL